MATSYEIAVRLRDAGFPQPSEPDTGQYWYDHSKRLCFLYVFTPDIGGEPEIAVLSLEGGHSYNIKKSQFAGYVYAPTEGEILRELDGLSSSSWFTLGFMNGHFECCEMMEVRAESDKPADACAMMYLEAK